MFSADSQFHFTLEGAPAGYHDASAMGLLLLVLGAIAMVAPLFSSAWGVPVIGLAVFLAGIVDLERSRRTGAAHHPAYGSGVLSLVAGVIVFLQPNFVFSGLMATTSVVLGIDGAVKVTRALRRRTTGGGVWGLFNGATNLVLALVVWEFRNSFGALGFGLLMGARIAASGWEAVFARAPSEADEFEDIEDRHPDAALGLAPHPIIGFLHREAIAHAGGRQPIDFYWSVIFVATFFAIHVGRLDAEWTWLGMISPVAATVGDILAAIVLALVVLRPVESMWRWLTRPVERLVWHRMLEDVTPLAGQPVGERVARQWAEFRLRRTVGRDLENNTLAGAVRQTIRAGLPVWAVVIAINPIWGFSWYFNSENWATAVWQKITETRTDTWRAAMIDAVAAQAGAADPTASALFAVQPAGTTEGADFSFLVIGDPGEGDPSQHALRDQVLFAARRDEVKFLVIASDVIYPAGAMKDYEPNFYLPLKGVEKPVYAIPGNHDWFNALDGFAPNFMRPEAARAAMAARVDADLNLSSTTDERIEQSIAEAARLRALYRLRAGEQRGPFFELHAGAFSLVAVDTGILRRVDDRQMAWLRAALDRSAGTFTMVILGHPFYAAGAYQAADDELFRSLHDLLTAHGVSVVMAGDTHDFEYYRVPGAGPGSAPVHHFVNGGGGAYLSIGTALDWPAHPPVADYAFYPSTDAVTAKLNAETPLWKWPAWWWVRRFGAWPFSVEALSAVFDFNRAPFFQSFMEVRVEGSAHRVRLVLYGVDGPLRWRDVQAGGGTRPADRLEDDVVEFVVPMP